MKIKPLIAVIFIGIILFWAVEDMPAFGDPELPATKYTGELYVKSASLISGLRISSRQYLPVTVDSIHLERLW